MTTPLQAPLDVKTSVHATVTQRRRSLDQLSLTAEFATATSPGRVLQTLARWKDHPHFSATNLRDGVRQFAARIAVGFEASDEQLSVFAEDVSLLLTDRKVVRSLSNALLVDIVTSVGSVGQIITVSPQLASTLRTRCMQRWSTLRAEVRLAMCFSAHVCDTQACMWRVITTAATDSCAEVDAVTDWRH